ncbi:hypothetical protein DW830_10695 [Prevotella sp. AM34-19LB]|uniref:hypothetical protein n=1 Tax=Prevotella sp. AM34-19LB TaxID=2292364 RepID=UPI000E5CE412|nr:hypothetical protein [Prevotella sp. AM34-19LB]RHC74922.1 hypothetical protein DW830_10695 [Prevotella sp. AM34-19LB]
MKHFMLLLILGGSDIYIPNPFEADSYILSYSLVYPNQIHKPGSRSPKCPLVVDLVDHTLTLPSQVIGNTLTLESEEGDVYTYYIIDTTFQIPKELSGEYSLKISDGNSMYQGVIELK